MICRNCGNAIRDDAKFCPHCGAVSGATAAPGYAGPEAPVPGRSKKGLLIGGIVAVAAIIAVAAAVMSGIFSSPKGKLEKAIIKSLAAYAAVSDSVGMPDLNELTDQRSVSQRFSMELNSVNSTLAGYDMSALSGLGLRMNTDLSGKDRKLGITLGAFWGEDDLVSLQVLADDDKLYVSSPQFTDGTAYGVNTETLGADLKKMTGDDSVEDISFNIFDLMDVISPEGQAEEMKKTVKDANKALWEAVRVEKDGKESITVNGQSVNAESFRVVIPKKALDEYVTAIEVVLSSIDYIGLYEEMLNATGLPQEQIDEVMAQLEEADIYGELSDTLHEFVEMLGDVRLTVYVSGGYVSAVSYEERIRGSSVKAELQLGGGDTYVNDFSLDFSVDDNRVQVASSGDHGGKRGAFSDKTTIRLSINGMSMGKITSDCQYDPKAAGSNLRWELSMDGIGTLNMAGQLTTGKDSLDLQMGDISLRVMGMEVCSFGINYYVGPCQGVDLSASSPKLVAEMNMIELLTLASDLERRANTWADDMDTLFAQRLPTELYYSLF